MKNKNSTPDLLQNYESLPLKIQNILNSFEDESYEECRRIESELNSVGYGIEWYLDASPFNLHKL